MKHITMQNPNYRIAELLASCMRGWPPRSPDLIAWWRAYITVALMCGLRPGELLGLRWEDVDFKTGVIRVRKCLKALPDPETGKRTLVLETLKTERSKRTIRMPRQAVTVLLTLRKEQTAARLKLGALYDTRGLAIVFGDGAGAPRWPQDVRRQFTRCAGAPGSARAGHRGSSGTRS